MNHILSYIKRYLKTKYIIGDVRDIYINFFDEKPYRLTLYDLDTRKASENECVWYQFNILNALRGLLTIDNGSNAAAEYFIIRHFFTNEDVVYCNKQIPIYEIYSICKLLKIPIYHLLYKNDYMGRKIKEYMIDACSVAKQIEVGISMDIKFRYELNKFITKKKIFQSKNCTYYKQVYVINDIVRRVTRNFTVDIICSQNRIDNIHIGLYNFISKYVINILWSELKYINGRKIKCDNMFNKVTIKNENSNNYAQMGLLLSVINFYLLDQRQNSNLLIHFQYEIKKKRLPYERFCNSKLRSYKSCFDDLFEGGSSNGDNSFDDKRGFSLNTYNNGRGENGNATLAETVNNYIISTKKSSFTYDTYNHVLVNYFKLPDCCIDIKEKKTLLHNNVVVLHVPIDTRYELMGNNVPLNKPLVRPIFKQKNMTGSYYKSIHDDPLYYSLITYNFNIQCTTSIKIRTHMLQMTEKYYNYFYLSHSNQLSISNICTSSSALHDGIIDTLSYRGNLLRKYDNYFKVPSFPAMIRYDSIDKTKTTLLHRDTVLTRIHVDYSIKKTMVPIIDEILSCTEMLPFFVNLIYEIEGGITKEMLHYRILGLAKLLLLKYYELGDEAVKNIVSYFNQKLLISRFIIAQYDQYTIAPQFIDIKKFDALSNTSIRNKKCNNIIRKKQMFLECKKKFPDAGLNPKQRKLWQKRGRFSFLDVILFSSNKTFYNARIGEMKERLKSILMQEGGRKKFSESLRTLDLFDKYYNAAEEM